MKKQEFLNFYNDYKEKIDIITIVNTLINNNNKFYLEEQDKILTLYYNTKALSCVISYFENKSTLDIKLGIIKDSTEKILEFLKENNINYDIEFNAESDIIVNVINYNLCFLKEMLDFIIKNYK